MRQTQLHEKRAGYPNPLMYHLTAALHAAEIQGASTPKEFADGVAQLSEMLSGLKKWQSFDYERKEIAPAPIWQKGSAKLYDFGESQPSDAPVLVIPSLVNKSYILDLSTENSLIRRLSASGLRPFLLNWGSPGLNEQNFTISDYIQNRALPALNVAQQTSGQSVGVLGYCMGGTIAAAVAQLSTKVNSLSTIGAPWDFGAPSGNRLMLKKFAASQSRQQLESFIDNMAITFGALPFECLQYLFASLNPNQAFNKFRNFAKTPVTEPQAKTFTMVEDWLCDGVALAGPAAKDLFLHWHLDNAIVNAGWRVGDTIIDATKITVPGLFACAQKDTITPLDTTLTLPNLVPNSNILLPNCGHVGMVIGRDSHKSVAQPIADFHLKHAN